MKKPDDTRKVPPADRLAEVVMRQQALEQLEVDLGEGFGLDAGSGMAEMIEAEERAGGEQMLHAEVVPTDGSEALEELGFVLGDVVADDPIFRAAKPPAGWRREPGDNPHDYWTYFVDDQGQRRVAMFYKAAFYDRSARCSVVSEPYRFTISRRRIVSVVGRFQVEELLDHGFTMRFPAGQHERFSPSAAEGMIGQDVDVNADDLGIERIVRMRVRAAELVDNGRAVVATLTPLELADERS